ncbi:hypothetical protein PGTUg99_022072 [Puccinia graminis f. sp. tritici]|uniref:Uncharacterized protein n=1 Tax=Puccinia graminis f. sp. tritici TaxID=56615 RepID=A0A5B0SL26_PUCGR|nr:hypothetical protein PGTUg99_022072 [Puccinia graminis f. sp. tritici]
MCSASSPPHNPYSVLIGVPLVRVLILLPLGLPPAEPSLSPYPTHTIPPPNQSSTPHPIIDQPVPVTPSPSLPVENYYLLALDMACDYGLQIYDLDCILSLSQSTQDIICLGSHSSSSALKPKPNILKPPSQTFLIQDLFSQSSAINPFHHLNQACRWDW